MVYNIFFDLMTNVRSVDDGTLICEVLTAFGLLPLSLKLVCFYIGVLEVFLAKWKLQEKSSTLENWYDIKLTLF